MKRLSVPLILAVMAVGSVAGPPARADFAYSTNSTPQVVAADGGTKSVIFLLDASGTAVGSSSINLTSSIGLSAVDPSTPSHFNNRPFSVSLGLTDSGSGTSHLFNFNGLLNGTMSTAAADLMVSYTGATSGSATLGGSTYTVSVVPGPGPMSLAPVGVFPGLYLGNLTAQVDILSGAPGGGGGGGVIHPPGGGGGGDGGGGGGVIHPPGGGGISDTPEPSTLVASGVGLAFLGLAGWRKRRAKLLIA